MPQQVPILLFFGIVRPYKGLDILLEAISILKNSAQEIFLVVAGEIWEGKSRYQKKIAADKLVESYWLSFQMPVTTIRPFNTFGPRQSMRAIIPTIIGQALTGEKLKLGSLSPVRDFTYAEDTANGFIASVDSEKAIGETINLGYGEGISIGDLAAEIREIMGNDFEILSDDQRVRPDNSEVMKLISNNQKAKALMGWEPRIDLKNGLLKTVRYMEEYLHEYKVERYNV